MGLKKGDLPKVIVLAVLIAGSLGYVGFTLVFASGESGTPAVAAASTASTAATATPAGASPTAAAPSAKTQGAGLVASAAPDPLDPARFHGAGPVYRVKDPFSNPREQAPENLLPAAPLRNGSGLPSSGSLSGRGLALPEVGGVEYFDPATGAPMTPDEAKSFNGYVITRRRSSLGGGSSRSPRTPSARPVSRPEAGPGALPSPSEAESSPQVAANPAGADSSAAPPASPEQPKPLLTGTIQGAVPMAVIRFPETSKRYVARVGDWLEGAYEVTEISSARVVLRGMDGRPKVLALGGRPDAT